MVIPPGLREGATHSRTCPQHRGKHHHHPGLDRGHLLVPRCWTQIGTHAMMPGITVRRVWCTDCVTVYAGRMIERRPWLIDAGSWNCVCNTLTQWLVNSLSRHLRNPVYVFHALVEVSLRAILQLVYQRQPVISYSCMKDDNMWRVMKVSVGRPLGQWPNLRWPWKNSLNKRKSAKWVIEWYSSALTSVNNASKSNYIQRYYAPAP